MKFKKSLKNLLKNDLTKQELDIIPLRYHIIGSVILTKLNPQLLKKKKKICQKILELNKSCKTIYLISRIYGQYRKPKILYQYGDKEKSVIHREGGILYKLDPSRIMFSKGNFIERKRIIPLVKSGETIVDMFCGVGYFSLGLTKFSKARRVYAIELNPTAYKYLNENIKLNKLDKKKIKAIKGDCTKILPKLKIKADRIIMGYLPDAFPYLDAALRVARKSTIIHYSCLINKNESRKAIDELVSKIGLVASKNRFKVELFEAVLVKSYSPGLDHYVLDLRVM